MRHINLNEDEVKTLMYLFDLAEEECGGLLKKQLNLKNKIKRVLRPPIKSSSRNY